jgi:hypothetical protein
MFGSPPRRANMSTEPDQLEELDRKLTCCDKNLYLATACMFEALYLIQKSPNDSGQPNGNNFYLEAARRHLADAGERLTRLHFYGARRDLLEAIDRTRGEEPQDFNRATTMANAVGEKVLEVMKMIDHRCSS